MRLMNSMGAASLPVGVTVHFDDDPLKVAQPLQAVASKKTDKGFQVR